MSDEEIKGEKERKKRVGDDLEDEPDAVDIKQPGEESGGLDIEETWHRAGSKSPGSEEKEQKPASESEEKKA